MKDFLLRNTNKITTLVGLRLLRNDTTTNPEKMLSRLLRSFKIDLVLDVGANAGQSAKKIFASGYKGRIISFEPVPGPFKKLKSKAAKNPQWSVIQAAIGEMDGEIEIYVAENLESSSILPMLPRHKEAAPDSKEIGVIKTPLLRLDSLKEEGKIGNQDCIFLKIDVQGFELQVIKGSLEILNQVHVIQLEMSLVPLYEGSPLFEEVLSTLKQYGFSLFSLIPGFSDPDTGQLLQMDGIFIQE